MKIGKKYIAIQIIEPDVYGEETVGWYAGTDEYDWVLLLEEEDYHTPDAFDPKFNKFFEWDELGEYTKDKEVKP